MKRVKISITLSHLATVLWLTMAPSLGSATVDVIVRNADEFREAVNEAGPGVRVLLASGTYPGGFFFSDLRGETNRPIVIAAADPSNPPLIQGGGTGLHLSRPAFVELHGLVIRSLTVNGLNVDDGGSIETPAHHLVLRGLKVSDVGPGGNHDCIKLSGVQHFRVEQCQMENWGTGGGSGIDMVGCHRGVIESNLFRHTDSVGSTGVQAKGGSSQITVRRNRFESAGGRAVNIGGSTGLQFFRPPLAAGEPHWEAKDIHVEGNTFIGSGAPVAFVGVDGASVRFNTIYHPKRWVVRILQENREPGFVPSRNSEFSDNLVAFDSHDWVEGGVNIGPGTAPETFTFARNWWYCVDDAARSRPRLPVEETGGVYGKDPLFRHPEHGDLRLRPGTPANQVGADALRTLSPSAFQGSKAGDECLVTGIRLCWCPPGTFSGNTFEWCRDWYQWKLPGGIDPDLHKARASATKSEHGTRSRVRRGGCWADEGWPCRSAFRLRFEPERRYDHIGFRVVAVQTSG